MVDGSIKRTPLSFEISQWGASKPCARRPLAYRAPKEVRTDVVSSRDWVLRVGPCVRFGVLGRRVLGAPDLTLV